MLSPQKHKSEQTRYRQVLSDVQRRAAAGGPAAAGAAQADLAEIVEALQFKALQLSGLRKQQRKARVLAAAAAAAR